MRFIRDTITRRAYRFGTHIILSYSSVTHNHTLIINNSRWNTIVLFILDDKYERDAIKSYNIQLESL